VDAGATDYARHVILHSLDPRFLSLTAAFDASSIFRQALRDGDCPPVVARYLNRLSDFLFTAARYAALREGRVEVPYKKA